MTIAVDLGRKATKPTTTAVIILFICFVFQQKLARMENQTLASPSQKLNGSLLEMGKDFLLTIIKRQWTNDL